MTVDRMTLAVDRIERALARLEAFAKQKEDGGNAISQSPLPDGLSRDRAVAALQSLDSLISDLKARA
ncbi:MAG: hypothetical protein DI547_00690 [Sphingobium sp.]|jgi:hypothetical protein|nr:MAG: hypothetical protein DI547_00690 [Sphingobium sp.]